MLRDFRYAFRVLAARPLFTVVAALSLALGIGANSAIFGLIDGLWFRPLAVPQPTELVRLFSVSDREPEGALSYPEFLTIQQQAHQLHDVVAIGGRGATLIQGDRRQLLNLNLVSSNFFTAMGLRPLLGRLFTPQDEADPSQRLNVVLGNTCWQRWFGSDPGIVGKRIRIQRAQDVLFTVIGVLPASFRDIDPGSDQDLWFPHQAWAILGNPEELEERGNRWFSVMGRLAPGASEKSAGTEVQAIASRMAASFPATNKGRAAAVVSDLHFRMKQAGANGLALLAIVFLVVLISSMNVANLLLSRAGVRGREMAIRLALGGGRSRIIRQLMAENLLLGALALAGGIAIGIFVIAILPALIIQPPGFAFPVDFRFDSRVLMFSVALSMLTVVLFGLLPAWKSARPDLVPALKGEAAFGSAGRHWPLRNWLAVAEVAIAMTLLVSAGVLVRSFANTRTQDLGFARKQLLLVWLYSDHAKPALYRDVITHFEAMPGVRRVAMAVRAPLSLADGGMFKHVTLPGRPEFANAPAFEIKYNSVTRDCLRIMGTPLLRGRGFEPQDEIDGATSVLINQTMAQRFWPGQEAVGKMIRIGGASGKTHTIIGVVKNAPINQIGEPTEPYMYLAYWPNFEEEATFIVETQTDAAALTSTARRVLKSVDSRLDPLTIVTENDLIRYSAQKFEVTAELVGTLGFLGLLLTAVGLYGVVSYGVSQRTRELGIRMALGADRGQTLRMVLREVAVLGLVGIAVGLPLALAATRLIQSVLFGMGPWDVPTFAAATLVLSAVLLLAGFLPARRATTIEPVSALRVV